MRFGVATRNPFARSEVRSAKAEVKLRLGYALGKSFARNEVRWAKTEVKLRFPSATRKPFARNEVRSAKTELKLRFWRVRTPFRKHNRMVQGQKVREKSGLMCKVCVKASVCKRVCV